MPQTLARHAGDIHLVRRFQNGEPDANEEIARRLSCAFPIITSLSRGFGGDLRAEDKADVAQDAITKAIRRLGTYQGRARLETWMYRICFWELMTYVRRKRRYARALVEYRTNTPVGEEAPAHRDPRFEEIERAIDGLAWPRDEILRLRHFRGLDPST